MLTGCLFYDAHSKLCPWTWAAAASGAEETAGLVSMAARPPLTLAARAPPRGPLLTFLRPRRGPASLLQWTRLAPRWWLSPSLSRNPSPADTTCILPVSTLSACRMRATTKTAIWDHPLFLLYSDSPECVYGWEVWTVGKPLCCVLFLRIWDCAYGWRTSEPAWCVMFLVQVYKVEILLRPCHSAPARRSGSTATALHYSDDQISSIEFSSKKKENNKNEYLLKKVTHSSESVLIVVPLPEDCHFLSEKVCLDNIKRHHLLQNKSRCSSTGRKSKCRA